MERQAGGGPGKCGERLRELRGHREMSPAQLTRRAHYSKGCLNKVENGRMPPTPDRAIRLDDVLDGGGELLALLPAPPAPSPSTPGPAGAPPTGVRPRGARVRDSPEHRCPPSTSART